MIPRAVRGLWRRARNRLDRPGLVLLYHRIAAPDTDPWGLCVSPQHFEAHLEVLRAVAAPVPAARLSASLTACTRPAVALTFDDGYADNLHTALPLLERHDVPATLFVTTAAMDDTREFWWDELDRILLQPGPWTHRQAELPGISAPQVGAAAIEDLPGARRTLYLRVYRALQPLDPAARRDVLDALLAWAELDPEPRAAYRALSADEVLLMAGSALVEIGAHTRTHPYLPALADAAQRNEVMDSQRRLEDLLAAPVSAFAYPHGVATRCAARAVAEAGFSRAYTTAGTLVRRRTSRFRLPRVAVDDLTAEAFETALHGWLTEAM